jgi:hypothetical protein
MPKNETPIEAVQRYLREARTESGALLAKRPVIGVWPFKNRGRIIWGLAILTKVATSFLRRR